MSVATADSSPVTCFDCSDALPDEWDALVDGQSVFLDRAYLRLLEQYAPPEIALRFALVAQRGKPVAAVVAQFIRVENDLLEVRGQESTTGRMRTALRNTGLGLLGRRVLVVGNVFSCGLDGVAFAPGVDPVAYWSAVLHAVEALQREYGRAHFAVVKDFPVADTAHKRALSESGFHRLQIEPSMELSAPAEWQTRADYLAALNTKYRKAARKLDEAIAAAGIIVEPLHDLAPEAPRLHELYAAVEQRAAMRFGLAGPGYLPALAQWAGPGRFRCTVLRQKHRIVGFSFVLKNGDKALAHVVGFDYVANETAPVYLSLLHSIIDDGLALGCRTLHYGRTALEPKARLGAVPIDTEIWIRHANPVVNRLVPHLLRLVPQHTAPQRAPFRQ